MTALAKIRLKSATGLAVYEDQLVSATVATTLVGQQVVDTHKTPINAEGLAAGLKKLNEEGRLQGEISVGVSPRRASLVTRRLKEGSDSPADESEAAGVSLKDFVADSAPIKLPSGNFSSTAFCDRQFARQVLFGLSSQPTSRLKLKPATLSLHRLAMLHEAGPKRWKTVIRVLPGESSYLAILSHAGAPLAQRLFERSKDSRDKTILVVVSGLLAHATGQLGLRKVDGILFHTEEDCSEIAKLIEDSLGIPVQPAAEVTLDEETVAESLALSSLRPQSPEFDLFRTLRPPPGLRENFPLATAIVLGIIVIVTFWMLRSEAVGLETRISDLERQAKDDAAFAKTTLGEVGLKYESLLKEVDVVHAFVVKRVFWTQIIREVSQCLPESLVLTVLKGHDTISVPNRLTKQQQKKSKKYLTAKKGAKVRVQKDLVIGGAVQVEKRDTKVPEIPVMLDALRSSKLIRKEFPMIGGADLELKEVRNEDIRDFLALFSVKCQIDPKKKKK